MTGAPGPWHPGPSDPGLAGERTSLAWARMGMSLLAFPSAVLAYAAGRSGLALAAAALSAALGLGVLTISLRRHRAAPGMVATRSLRLANEEVLLTGGSVLALGVSALLLVWG